MPMLLAGFEPNHITWTNLLNRSALSLHPSASVGDDQRLTEGMSVPGGWHSRLKIILTITRMSHYAHFWVLTQRAN
jgi:hypothetical protein